MLNEKKLNTNGLHKPPARRIADLDGPDFYPTPDWVTKALIDHEPFQGEIWECACGDGAMAEVLKTTDNPVLATDLHSRGYGISGEDFLTSKRISDNIVTNPPFHSAEDFIRKALKSINKKAAFLLRLAFLEGIKRHNTLFSVIPPARVWVFSERITFYPATTDKKAGSGTTAYAWFVWDKQNTSGQTELKWLKPGYKTTGRKAKTLPDPKQNDLFS